MLKPDKPILIKDLGILHSTSKSAYRARYGLYMCSCGKEFKATKKAINSSSTRSCGCYRKKVTGQLNTIHGLSNSDIYILWNSIIQRVKPNNVNSKNYYDRGIRVCDEWRDVYVFIKWASSNGFSKKLDIDRIDNDKGYCPENCRFVTRSINVQNTRLLRSNNTTGYRGITWLKKNKKWKARIAVNKKEIYIGVYTDKIEAAKAYDNYVIENNLYHTLNFKTTKDK